MNKLMNKFKKSNNTDIVKAKAEKQKKQSFYTKLSEREKNLISVMISLVTIMVFMVFIWKPGLGKIQALQAEKQVMTTQTESMQQLIGDKDRYVEKKGEAMVKLSRVQDNFLSIMPAEEIDSIVTDIIKESGYTPGELSIEFISADEAKVTIMAVGNTYNDLMALVAAINSRRYIAIDSFESVIAGETDPEGGTSLKKVTSTETRTRLVPIYDEETGTMTYDTEEYEVPKEEYVEVGKEETIQAVRKVTNMVFTVKMVPEFNQ